MIKLSQPCWRGPSRPLLTATTLSGVMAVALLGCERRSLDSDRGPALRPATLQVRAARRAYDGAPPVIPHEPFGFACSKCHHQQAELIPTVGIAPANPHLTDRRRGNFTNCTQCHVFSSTDDVFAANSFRGLPIDEKPTSRAYPGAPPVISHAIGMRSNCLACHAGPGARPEIVCSHPERSNCLQCHVAVQTVAAEPSDLTSLPQ